MDRLRLGVVGTGRMGRSHCRVYANLRHAELIGVYDQSLHPGHAVAEANQVTFYDSLEALLEGVDAVSIATPTPTHFDIAMQCLECGVHVLIEKPITQTVRQAEMLVQAACTSKLVAQVGHIERFNPAYRELKHVVDGTTMLAVDFRRLSPFLGSNTDVDVVLDLMIHDIDLASGFGRREPIKHDRARITAHNGPIDYAVAQLQFASGLFLSMTASRMTEQKVRMAEVTALDAYITADLLSKTCRCIAAPSASAWSTNHAARSIARRTLWSAFMCPPPSLCT
ncbi:MAG: Gfo/Idh/MocA family oxidoreductase [Anaerolineae bacterium]|nr:Gfo/Idh/MocA family oxidoreductase [Anaerolineae bacterium]